MTLPIGEVIGRFEALIAEMEAEWPTAVAEGAQDALALIEERITTTGTGPSGSALKPYTVPYQKFKQYPKATKRGRELGLASSRFTGKTDYTLTGHWWKDVQVRNLQRNGDTVSAQAGVTTAQNLAIMESLTKRDGFPLRLSDEEKEIVGQNYKIKISAIVERYFPLN